MNNTIEILKNLDIATDKLNFMIDSLTAQEIPLGDLLAELQNISLAQGGLAKLSNLTGLSRESLYKILSHNGNPHLSTFLEIIGALGFKVKFEKTKKQVFINQKKTLALAYPELAKQWNYEKNKLLPNDVLPGSHLKVWWICSKGDDHKWVASIAKRVSGGSCPICSGQKVVSSNSLSNTHAELAAEWCFEKNLNLDPSQVMAGSTKKVWWRCSKNQNHEWNSFIRNRVIGKGCPFCN